MTLSAFGMNLHAATTADGRDRKQLERICRYLLHPPFAHDAVTALPGGRGRRRPSAVSPTTPMPMFFRPLPRPGHMILWPSAAQLVDPAPPSTYAVDQDALAGVEAIDANGRSRHDRQVDGVILTDPGHCILCMLDEPVSFGL
jgi:hypothetical protein